MDEISPVAGVGIGSLLTGVIALVWRVLGTRSDPKLIDLISEQNAMMKKKDEGDDKVAEAMKLQAQETAALREAISGEIGELRKANADLRIENAAQKTQLDIVTKAQNTMRLDLETQNAAFQKTHRADTGEITRLKSDLLETGGKLKRANEDREAMEIRVSNLEQQNAELRENNATLDARVAELEEAMKSFKDLILEERTRREEAEAQVNRLKQQVAEKDAQLAEKDVEIDRLREANAMLLKNTHHQKSEDKETVTS